MTIDILIRFSYLFLHQCTYYTLIYTPLPQKQGFLSDALTILSKAYTVPSITTEERAQCQLLQAMYLIMRLEVGRALELLRGSVINNELKSENLPFSQFHMFYIILLNIPSLSRCDCSTSAACQILTIYCDWVTAINTKDEHFDLPPAAHFSKVEQL